MDFNFNNLKVVLLGDFMLDHYIYGLSSRMSPEVDAPVIIPKKEAFLPGGAGNVAMNLMSLGAQVHCAGVVGDDEFGHQLINIFSKNRINTDLIKIDNSYQTIVKQRIFSNGVQIARLDREEVLKFKNDYLSKINFKKYDLLMISDYNKGVVSKEIELKTKPNLTIVDPKKTDFGNYNYANIITPNLFELQKATSININDRIEINNSCFDLISKNNFNNILLKKGDKGMTIYGKNNFMHDIMAHKVKNPDVTGAGDTVIATLGLVYSKTKDILYASEVANLAASIVVNKEGTATTSVREIKNLLSK